ncbi:hypothetical protein [Cellulomonas cellasea]|uniref:Uncharacterized protein n=1 Tax=Cellulomonas cellasea TaxID=43670 RepID=A0A7W4UGN1_9CELL|nr:hypothetical protein [Cellulomonas cellasea]MBB2923449.1 hypothetical protein [Cellulomonas cellasea]
MAEAWGGTGWSGGPPAGWTGGGAGAVAPFVARAAGTVHDAARRLVAAQHVDWVSDAATRYREALDEAHRQVLATAALVEAALEDVRAADRAAALHATGLARAAAGVPGGAS